MKFIICWLCTFFLFSCATKSLRDNEFLKICADPNNYPLSNKALTGYENKLAKLLSLELNKELYVEWFPQKMGFLRNTLKSKNEFNQYKCDIIIGVPTKLDSVLTTVPYYKSSYSILYKKNKWRINSLKEFVDQTKMKIDDLKIGHFSQDPVTDFLLVNGLYNSSVAFQKLNGVTDSNAHEIISKEINSGSIDAFIAWGPIVHNVVINQKEEFDVYNIRESDIGAKKFIFDISMGVRKNDYQMKTILDQFILSNKEKINFILRESHIPEL